MALRLHQCACGHPAMLETGAINRAARRGWPIYCTRECAGIARRNPSPPTDAERRAAKAAYDAQYREANREALKAKKAAYYAANHDREKERAYRQRRMPQHVEYCRRPEYRAWKAAYDRQYLAAQHYGEFAEAALALRDLEAEIGSHITRQEIYAANGTQNKSISRRRDYDRIRKGA